MHTPRLSEVAHIQTVQTAPSLRSTILSWESLSNLSRRKNSTTLPTPFITLPNPSTSLRVQVLIGIVSLISLNSPVQNVFPEAREGFRRGPGTSPFFRTNQYIHKLHQSLIVALQKIHKIRITLSSRKVASLEKVCQELIERAKSKSLTVKGPG